MTPSRDFIISGDHDGRGLASVLKKLLPELTWSQVKRTIETRRITVNKVMCIDEGRRIKAGDVIGVHVDSPPKPPSEKQVPIVYVDDYLVVLNKPAGIMSLRRHEERDWSDQKKALQPTLDEIAARLTKARVYDVHRIDRDTSGMMLFARTPVVQRDLIRMFKQHHITRAYWAVVEGHPHAQTIESRLVRNRGDGLRGSLPGHNPNPSSTDAEHAITHITPLERIGPYSIIECRLETGRTHQIRIHLSEVGHRLCGEPVYTHATGAAPLPDQSHAPRQALHSAKLEMIHPITKTKLELTIPWPADLAKWLDRLRKSVTSPD